MIDINKIKELKWLLDEGTKIDINQDFDEFCIELEFFKHGKYWFRITKEFEEEVEIFEVVEKDFDTFCKEVARVILESQED